MIKRIIFDLDNTLIEWKEEYWDSIEKALIRSNIKYTKIDAEKIKEAVNNYEMEYNIYKKEYMLECMKTYSNLNLKIEFIDNWIDELSKCAPEKLDEEIIDTLEYLYKKYELVVLTNWFKISQINRMNKVNITKYFKEIYTPEEFLNKPNKQAFLIASENKIDECIMVGDTFDVDIKGALNVGMKAIYINKEGKENKDYITIKNFNELKEIM